ncbi:hypothetical protein KBB68_02090 [Candidatus Babeliales bacterium]|nr:hypothetical protein [Candidatus Babeliales bacterium]
MIDQNGIYISKKQASVTAALLVVLGLLLFVGGYFWGKQSVIDGFTQKTSQESFNDQVDYLLTMQSFAAKNGGVMPEELISTESDKNNQQAQVEELLANLPDAVEENSMIKTDASKVKVEKVEATVDLKSGKYFAMLAGFGKKISAEQMVQRLKKRKIDVEIKVKSSKSASGKSRRAWYQVVTKSYDSVQDVQQIVDKILMFEKIKRTDIKIV